VTDFTAPKEGVRVKFNVPLVCDRNREPLALFSATTSAGEIVILFSDMSKWDRFTDAVSPVLRASDQFLASVTLEAATFEHATEQLVEIYPGVLNDASFVPDTAPIVNDVIQFFASQS
jgi:hypothetical protein